jgi:hypothetical protein
VVQRCIFDLSHVTQDHVDYLRVVGFQGVMDRHLATVIHVMKHLKLILANPLKFLQDELDFLEIFMEILTLVLRQVIVSVMDVVETLDVK